MFWSMTVRLQSRFGTGFGEIWIVQVIPTLTHCPIYIFFIRKNMWAEKIEVNSKLSGLQMLPGWPRTKQRARVGNHGLLILMTCKCGQSRGKYGPCRGTLSRFRVSLLLHRKLLDQNPYSRASGLNRDDSRPLFYVSIIKTRKKAGVLN